MNVPNYVTEEIEKYKHEKVFNHTSIITYENAKSFIRLAYVNGWLSEQDKDKLLSELDSV